jgi:hypothetical protein
MAFNTNFRNDAVNAVAQNGAANVYSLHTGDPGTTGANEVTGGSPPYARKTATGFPTSTTGTATNSQVVFDVPPGTISHWGRWKAGVFYEGGALPASELYNGQGTLGLTHTVSHPAT